MTAPLRERLEATLNEATDCIEALGNGRGGWAWEDVIDSVAAIKAEALAALAEREKDAEDAKHWRFWLKSEAQDAAIDAAIKEADRG